MPLSAEDLKLAVARGIITHEQHRALIDFAAIQQAKPAKDLPDSIDENMRLVGGGNDIFVTIGVVLLSAGLFFALSSVFGPQTMILYSAIGLFLWLIAEFVTRQHRMRLSSTVLGIGFLICVGEVAVAFIMDRYDIVQPDNALQLAAMRVHLGTVALIVLGSLIAAAVIYFVRFKVPIMAGAIAVFVTLLGFTFAALYLYDSVTTGQVALPTLEQLPELLRNALYIPLICGLFIFAIGVYLDIHDRERITVWSDCAFWLHVVSAPLLVHPLFIMATGQDVVFGEIEPGTNAMFMLTLLILVFVYVALAIDRRSLLIPTLAYFGTLGIYYLVNSAANTTGIPPFALILLVVGALIMVFGAGWQRIRSLIVRPTLPTSVLNRLPPIKV